MTLEEAIKRVQKMITYMETLDADEEEQKDMEAYRMSVKALKAQRVGKWVRLKVHYMPYNYAYECTACRKWGDILTFEANYCPNCGAKMGREVERK